MEVDIVNANPRGLDLLGPPTLRTSTGCFEVLFQLINRGEQALHDCGADFLATDELANLIDFDQFKVSVLAPGEIRPVRLSVSSRESDVEIVTLSLNLAVAGVAAEAGSACWPEFLQKPFRPAELEVVMTKPASKAKTVQLNRHGTGALVIEDSARAVREGDHRVTVIAEVTNTVGQALPAVRLQVLGYDVEGFIVALDESGPWPLEPGQTRAARVELGLVEHAIVTIGLFAVSDSAVDAPSVTPS